MMNREMMNSMDTPSKHPDSSASSSPEGDSSRGTAEATSPSWAHVVRREASASTGSFTKPKAIGGQQGPALEPMATGGTGALPGEKFRIRKEGLRKEGGISIGSGCTEELEGQVTIPLPRDEGTPESGGARDSPGLTSSSDSSASASDRSREDGHYQGQKRQRRKAQRVLAGKEETRSQRKRRQKKQRGADLMADATREDIPMELRQLYRAEGVGAEAADLTELGQIWLTRDPPRTPIERAVEMRVQERAFAERWKEERRIREGRLEWGPGQVLTEEERQQAQQEDEWLGQHALQRHEINQLDRMAYIIGQWDWGWSVRTTQSQSRRQENPEGLRSVLDPACKRKMVGKLGPLQVRSVPTTPASLTMNLSEIQHRSQATQEDKDRRERERERHQFRFKGVEMLERMPREVRTPSTMRTPITPGRDRDPGGLGSPCIERNGLARSIGDATARGGRQITKAMAAHTCARCSRIIERGADQWHLIAKQGPKTENIYHCADCGQVEELVYRGPGLQEVLREQQGRYARRYNWDGHIPETQRRVAMPVSQVNHGYIQWPQEGDPAPLTIDAWIGDQAKKVGRLARADIVVGLHEQPRLCDSADQSPAMKEFTTQEIMDIGTRKVIQVLGALGMAPSMDQLVTASTSYLTKDFARRLGLVRDCLVEKIAKTLTDWGGQYWDPTDATPPFRAVGILRQLPSWDGWTLRPPQYPEQEASALLAQVTAESNEDFLLSQCGQQANSRAVDNRFMATLEALREMEQEGRPHTEEASQYIYGLQRYYRDGRAFVARAGQEHQVFKEMDRLYQQTHHTLSRLESGWNRHRAQSVLEILPQEWGGNKVPVYRAIAQGMQQHSVAETEQVLQPESERAGPYQEGGSADGRATTTNRGSAKPGADDGAGVPGAAAVQAEGPDGAGADDGVGADDAGHAAHTGGDSGAYLDATTDMSCRG
jgi:hypothetical protein